MKVDDVIERIHALCAKLSQASVGEQRRLIRRELDVIVHMARSLVRPPRRRNSRVQAVQAKRKRLGLTHDGRLSPYLGYVSRRGRKESYALALYCFGASSVCPKPLFVSKRDQRREQRRLRYEGKRKV